jgi:hypothetical protein
VEKPTTDDAVTAAESVVEPVIEPTAEPQVEDTTPKPVAEATEASPEPKDEGAES